MRKVLLIISLLIALVVVGSSLGASHHAKRSAATGFGQVVYSGGGACTGCNVDIHNGTTGARGSTLTNGNGTYTVNMNNTQQYEFSVWTCKVHSRYSSGWFAANGNQSFLPTLTASPFGAC